MLFALEWQAKPLPSADSIEATFTATASSEEHVKQHPYIAIEDSDSASSRKRHHLEIYNSSSAFGELYKSRAKQTEIHTIL